MARIALIQDQFSILNETRTSVLAPFERQLHEKFFEVLVEESGHEIDRAKTLEDYQKQGYAQPDLVICAPFSPEGNLAPGFAALSKIRQTFGDTPIVVWSSRDEEVVRVSSLEDHGAARYYTGTLLDAPDDFADMVLDLT